MDRRQRKPQAPGATARQNPYAPRQTAYRVPPRRRRMSPFLKLFTALLITTCALAVCYLIVYFPTITANARQRAARERPAPEQTLMQAHAPVLEPTAMLTPVPTPIPTPAPTPEPPAFDPDAPPVLVNRRYPVDESYSPGPLVKLIDVCPANIVKIKGSEILGNPVAVDALIEMLRAAVADGVGDWQISAGHRSYGYQQQLFDDKVAALMRDNNLSREKAKSAALKTVAPPGCSEHHTGLAFDITVPGTTFAGTPQAKWLAAHAHRYGFILRYQAHKEELTGYLAEAWHYRYVGVGPATRMFENDWCLEEYLDRL